MKTTIKPRRTKRRLEDVLQINAMRYIRAHYPHIISYHTANERKCSLAKGAHNKRLGVLAGVPDIQLYWDGQLAYIELKTEVGILTDTQKAFRAKAEKHGALYEVCRSVEEVKLTLIKWNVPITELDVIYAEDAHIEQYTARPKEPA